MADMITQGETMNRLIHGAVRRDLPGSPMRCNTPGDHARANALAEAFGPIDTMLTHHHEGEQRTLCPVIGDPAAGHRDDVAGLANEHESIAADLAASHDAFGWLQTSATAADIAAASAGLAQFRGHGETHCAH